MSEPSRNSKLTPHGSEQPQPIPSVVEYLAESREPMHLRRLDSIVECLRSGGAVSLEEALRMNDQHGKGKRL